MHKIVQAGDAFAGGHAEQADVCIADIARKKRAKNVDRSLGFDQNSVAVARWPDLGPPSGNRSERAGRGSTRCATEALTRRRELLV